MLSGIRQISLLVMACDGSSRMDSATSPRNSVVHCSFGSPIASEDRFFKATVSASALTGLGSASPTSPHGMQSPRGSLTAQSIIESTQALEAELQNLRQVQDEKDREIATLRATISLTSLADTAATGQTIGDSAARPSATSFADATGKTKAATADTYSILSPTLSLLKHSYARSCNLPIIGSVARVGLWTADACVSRTTRWASCEQVGKDVEGMLQYVDERVLTPHLHAAKSRSLAVCEPAIRKVEPLLARSSALFASMVSAPRGFVEAFAHRATRPAVWLREALRRWCGTPPGRLAMEDKLSRSAETASVEVASTDVTTGTGGIVGRVGGDELGTESLHD